VNLARSLLKYLFWSSMHRACKCVFGVSKEEEGWLKSVTRWHASEWEKKEEEEEEGRHNLRSSRRDLPDARLWMLEQGRSRCSVPCPGLCLMPELQRLPLSNWLGQLAGW
jgi:hypothetical protein